MVFKMHLQASNHPKYFTHIVTLHMNFKSLHRVLNKRICATFSILIQFHPFHIEWVHVWIDWFFRFFLSSLNIYYITICIRGSGNLGWGFPINPTQEIFGRTQRTASQVGKIGTGSSHRRLNGFGGWRLGKVRNSYWYLTCLHSYPRCHIGKRGCHTSVQRISSYDVCAAG